jgi:ribosomal protein S18 acetylase RimI-like enzyme
MARRRVTNMTAAGQAGQARIRRYRPADLDALYRICLLTADSGQDATALYDDPRLPGHLYAAPYGLFEPSLAFVAEDAGGVAGYVVGALDSLAFAERLESQWWPGLRGRYPEPPAELPPERWTPQQLAAHLIHHPWPTSQVAGRYPSHLHIDLLPRLQGHGHGRSLISALTRALRARGSAGLHLHVGLGNQRAAGFYRHVGFAPYPATDVAIFTMDLRDARPGGS